MGGTGVFYQTGVLVQRYIRTITHDRRRIVMILAFPLAISLVINWVAGEGMLTDYSASQACLFMVVCSTIFVGVCNAIQEICKERSIVKREYMANLSLGAYVLSKIIVQGLISAIEVAISGAVYLMAFGAPSGVMDPALDPQGGVLLPAALEILLSLFILMLSANAIGLLISALVRSSDAANTIAPYLLIVQIVFSGVLFNMEGFMDVIASLMVSKWGMSLMAVTYQLELLYPESIPGVDVGKLPALYEISGGNILLCWGILLGFVLVCLTTSVFVLRGVSRDTR